jgi:hypothetical protein
MLIYRENNRPISPESRLRRIGIIDPVAIGRRGKISPTEFPVTGHESLVYPNNLEDFEMTRRGFLDVDFIRLSQLGEVLGPNCMVSFQRQNLRKNEEVEEDYLELTYTGYLILMD